MIDPALSGFVLLDEAEHAALLTELVDLRTVVRRQGAWNLELLAALRLARTRLQICHGRMAACGQHEVSADEVPAWLAEMETIR